MNAKISRRTVLFFLLWCIPITSFSIGQFDPMAQGLQLQKIRDPFTPSKLMFDAVGKQSGNVVGGAFGFISSPNENVPKMRLLGFVTQDDDDPIALLEVAGSKTYIVHEGDEINIDPSQPMSVIRIAKITRLSITVETGRLGSIRVQR